MKPKSKNNGNGKPIDRNKLAIAQKIATVRTDHLRTQGRKDPELQKMIDIVDSQKRMLAGAGLTNSMDVATADGGIKKINYHTPNRVVFPSGISASFAATGGQETFFDGQNGVVSAVTGFTRGDAADVSGGTWGALTGTIGGGNFASNPQQITFLQLFKTDSDFSAVTLKIGRADASGGLQYLKNLDFNLGRHPYNQVTSVLEFDLAAIAAATGMPDGLILDNFTAFIIDTVAETDFSITMTLAAIHSVYGMSAV